MGPVVDVLADDLHGLRVQVGDFGPHPHDVEHDFVAVEQGKHVGSSQLIGPSLGLLQLKGVEDSLGHVVLLDWLFLGGAVVVHDDELVPEEVELSTDQRGEVIGEAEDGAGTHDGGVGEGLPHYLLTLELGLEVQRGRVGIGSSSGEVDEPMDSVLSAGLGDSLCYLNIDELKVLPLLELMPGTEQVDHHVGILHHALDLRLVLVIHAPIDPGAVCMGRKVLVGPVVCSSLRCSECLKLCSRLRGKMRLLLARPSSAAMGLPRFPAWIQLYPTRRRWWPGCPSRGESWSSPWCRHGRQRRRQRASSRWQGRTAPVLA